MLYGFSHIFILAFNYKHTCNFFFVFLFSSFFLFFFKVIIIAFILFLYFCVSRIIEVKVMI